MSADGFDTKYASVMESMLKSAIAETTKLFENMVNELKAEISTIKKENEDLKTRCIQFEATTSKPDDHVRTKSPALEDSEASVKCDIAVQCDLVPCRTVVVEECEPLIPSEEQNRQQIHYSLLEHDYVSFRNQNSEMDYFAVKEEPFERSCLSALKEEEFESNVTRSHVVCSRIGVLQPVFAENGQSTNKPEVLKGENTMSKKTETPFIINLPRFEVLDTSQGSVVISVKDAVKDDIKEESEVGQKLTKMREIAQKQQIICQDSNFGANSVCMQVQPLTESASIDTEGIETPDGSTVSQSPGGRRRGRPPKKRKQKKDLSSIATLNASSMDSSEVSSVNFTPSVIGPSEQETPYCASKAKSTKDASFMSDVSVNSCVLSEQKTALECQQLSPEVEQHTLPTDETTGISHQQNEVQLKKNYSLVSLQDAMLFVEAMNQSAMKNTLPTCQDKAEPMSSSNVDSFKTLNASPKLMFPNESTLPKETQHASTNLKGVCPPSHLHNCLHPSILMQPQDDQAPPVCTALALSSSNAAPETILKPPSLNITETPCKEACTVVILPTPPAPSIPWNVKNLPQTKPCPELTSEKPNIFPLNKELVPSESTRVSVDHQNQSSPLMEQSAGDLEAGVSTTMHDSIEPETFLPSEPILVLSSTTSESSSSDLEDAQEMSLEEVRTSKFAMLSPIPDQVLTPVVRILRLPFPLSTTESVLVSTLPSRGFSESIEKMSLQSTVFCSGNPDLSSPEATCFSEEPSVNSNLPSSPHFLPLEPMFGMSPISDDEGLASPEPEIYDLSTHSFKQETANSDVEDDQKILLHQSPLETYVNKFTKPQFIAQQTLSQLENQGNTNDNSYANMNTSSVLKESSLVSRLKTHVKAHRKIKRSITEKSPNMQTKASNKTTSEKPSSTSSISILGNNMQPFDTEMESFKEGSDSEMYVDEQTSVTFKNPSNVVDNHSRASFGSEGMQDDSSSSTLTEFISTSKLVKRPLDCFSPERYSISAVNEMGENVKIETISPTIKLFKLSAAHLSPEGSSKSSSGKKRRRREVGLEIETHIKGWNGKVMRRSRKIRSNFDSKKHEINTKSKTVKICKAKVWHPPTLPPDEEPCIDIISKPYIPSEYRVPDIPLNQSPIVSPVQPLAVIGKHLLRNQCGECGRVFNSKAALESHVGLHRIYSPFTCKLCGKSFPGSKSFKRHDRVHRNGRIHICQHCGRGFVFAFSLKKHIQIVHIKIKPFICQVCNRGFFTKREMEVHMRIHTGEKPFQCQICQRRFTRSVELNVHLRWHNGEKRHWCPYCGKGFLDYNNLKRHKYIHTGEKPYPCPHCPKKFSQTGHRTKHVKNVHKNIAK